MTIRDADQEQARALELKILRQISFASGLFQGDVTIRTLLESIPQGIVFVDNSGTILLVNNFAEKMFGYPNGGLVGKPHVVLVPARFRKVHEEQQAHFFAEPKIRPMGQLLDLVGLRQDGSEFPLEISLSFLETINGIFYLAFVSDITLRKQFETRLQETEELFQIQVEKVRDYAIFILDTRGNVLNWNAGAERMKGYRAEEIVGKHFSCFYPEEDRNAGKPEEMLKQAAAGGQVVDEGWRLRKDGSRFWAEVTITALHDENGDLWRFSKVTHDITERKLAELEATRHRILLEEAEKLARVGAWEWDIVEDRFHLSEEWLRIHGSEDANPSLQTLMPLAHPEDRDAIMQAFNDSIEKGVPYDIVHRVVRPSDGEVRVVQAYGYVTRDGSGNPIRMYGAAQDITERKNAELELLQKQRQMEELNLTLEQRVADAVADSRKKDRILILQGRQAAMGEMIGNVAHQWRQPLNMLGLVVQELRMTYGRDEFSKESLEAGVKKAMELIKHMSKTIDDFGNYYKPDKGKTLFNVNDAVARTLSLIEPGMKKLNIDIKVIEKDVVEITGYANEYSQVLLNILLNCRDAFEGRHIDMQRVIEITLFKENNMSVVTVADNAGGIPAGVMDKIFDPYFTTKGPDKGTGIGLFMAKTIIENNMGGKLTVHNADHGAEFRIEV